MKLIVGLGNPGEKYERTRHNAGFWLLERFAAQSATALRIDSKFQALVGRHQPSGVWLLLPQSFMNSSGRPVQMLASFFKVQPAEILVVHDELDFFPGVAKIKQGGGIAGHNGLRDISARLGTHDYWRLRIGIGHPGDRQGVTEYVLHKPGPDERAQIDDAIARALEVMPLVLTGDMQGAMLKLHTQEKAIAQAKDSEPAAQPAVKGSSRAAGNSRAAATLTRPEGPGSENETATDKTEPADAATSEKVDSDENAGQSGLKSLFKKFMPDAKQ